MRPLHPLVVKGSGHRFTGGDTRRTTLRAQKKPKTHDAPFGWQRGGAHIKP